MYLLKVKPESVTVMKVLDLYVIKGKGGFLNFKYAYTYFKLLSATDEGSKVYTAYFDVPVQDIQSNRLCKGCEILVEKQGKNRFKYLGPNGDWETMMNLGFSPELNAKLSKEFRSFSEKSVSLSYNEETHDNETSIEIEYNNEVIAKAVIKNDKVFIKKYDNKLGKKLLLEWLESRGFDTSNLLIYDI